MVESLSEGTAEWRLNEKQRTCSCFRNLRPQYSAPANFKMHWYTYLIPEQRFLRRKYLKVHEVEMLFVADGVDKQHLRVSANQQVLTSTYYVDPLGFLVLRTKKKLLRTSKFGLISTPSEDLFTRFSRWRLNKVSNSWFLPPATVKLFSAFYNYNLARGLSTRPGPGFQPHSELVHMKDFSPPFLRNHPPCNYMTYSLNPCHRSSDLDFNLTITSYLLHPTSRHISWAADVCIHAGPKSAHA